MKNETWTCECGYVSETIYCPMCGNKKPETPEEELERLRNENNDLRLELEKEKAERKKATDPESIAEVNYKQVKTYQKNYVHLALAILSTVVSVLTLAQLIASACSGMKFVTVIVPVVACLLVAPIEITAAVGFWRTWLGGMNKRNDADISRGPTGIRTALSITKAYVYAGMILAIIGGVAVLVWGGIENKGISGYLNSLGIQASGFSEIILAVFVVLALAAIVVFIALFFDAVAKFLDNIINRASEGKDYIYNTIFPAVLLCLVGLAVLIFGIVISSKSEAINEAVKNLWGDAPNVFDAVALFKAIITGLLLIGCAVSAVFYNIRQKKIDKECNSYFGK